MFGLISDHIGIGSTFLLPGGVMLVMSFVNLKVVRANGRKARVKQEIAEPLIQAE